MSVAEVGKSEAIDYSHLLPKFSLDETPRQRKEERLNDFQSLQEKLFRIHRRHADNVALKKELHLFSRLKSLQKDTHAQSQRIPRVQFPEDVFQKHLEGTKPAPRDHNVPNICEDPVFSKMKDEDLCNEQFLDFTNRFGIVHGATYLYWIENEDLPEDVKVFTKGLKEGKLLTHNTVYARVWDLFGEGEDISNDGDLLSEEEKGMVFDNWKSYSSFLYKAEKELQIDVADMLCWLENPEIPRDFGMLLDFFRTNTDADENDLFVYDFFFTHAPEGKEEKWLEGAHLYLQEFHKLDSFASIDMKFAKDAFSKSFEEEMRFVFDITKFDAVEAVFFVTLFVSSELDPKTFVDRFRTRTQIIPYKELAQFSLLPILMNSEIDIRKPVEKFNQAFSPGVQSSSWVLAFLLLDEESQEALLERKQLFQYTLDACSKGDASPSRSEAYLKQFLSVPKDEVIRSIDKLVKVVPKSLLRSDLVINYLLLPDDQRNAFVNFLHQERQRVLAATGSLIESKGDNSTFSTSPLLVLRRVSPDVFRERVKAVLSITVVQQLEEAMCIDVENKANTPRVRTASDCVELYRPQNPFEERTFSVLESPMVDVDVAYEDLCISLLNKKLVNIPEEIPFEPLIKKIDEVVGEALFNMENTYQEGTASYKELRRFKDSLNLHEALKFLDFLKNNISEKEETVEPPTEQLLESIENVLIPKLKEVIGDDLSAEGFKNHYDEMLIRLKEHFSIQNLIQVQQKVARPILMPFILRGFLVFACQKAPQLRTHFQHLAEEYQTVTEVEGSKFDFGRMMPVLNELWMEIETLLKEGSYPENVQNFIQNHLAKYLHRKPLERIFNKLKEANDKDCIWRTIHITEAPKNEIDYFFALDTCVRGKEVSEIAKKEVRIFRLLNEDRSALIGSIWCLESEHPEYGKVLVITDIHPNIEEREKMKAEDLYEGVLGYFCDQAREKGFGAIFQTKNKSALSNDTLLKNHMIIRLNSFPDVSLPERVKFPEGSSTDISDCVIIKDLRV